MQPRAKMEDLQETSRIVFQGYVCLIFFVPPGAEPCCNALLSKGYPLLVHIKALTCAQRNTTGCLQLTAALMKELFGYGKRELQLMLGKIASRWPCCCLLQRELDCCVLS